ncbi:meiotic cell cortex C-terminal pleckstrin homology-domain-containing protein [Massariosphaeria phaeospora]|uniref:Meiotic cell cortex C-terminal pleckstrin homology-domain-containing protein n=1 Tax=Massariosphaeria phaeospora TaxID=100035 RepID=A0A7C8MH29_9PLEO|nr:meiotic cell cortex C-terminal pleckstrin homology-domain-containing protein [Massariosphaeria phaeospora]
MATDYFSDNESFFSNQPLPTPADTPYHSLSSRTSRYGTPASDMGSSPAPFPPDPRDVAEDVPNGDHISKIDPRRFTPTLHASLVSEILSLRREVDSKHKFIEELETNVHTIRNENDSLTSQLSSSTKEGRTVKRQLQQLENGTLSALEEIAGERDQIKEANVDLKQKLEATQKRLRGQEDDSTRVHDMWAREKEVWTGEKRSLERRIHISESRLKMLLDEIAMQEAAQEEQDIESEGEDNARDSGVGHESDTASIRSSPQRRPSTRVARHSRNHSNGSYRSIGRSYRMSLMSSTSEGHGRMNGISLADELVFDEEEEDLGELELDSDDFPENEMRARRALESRQSMRQDEKAKRILGLSMENQQTTNKDIPSNTTAPDAPKSSYTTARSSNKMIPQEITLVFPPPTAQYVDTGVQPSPPSSPVRPDMVELSEPVRSHDTAASMAEVEANQSRKRISVPLDAITHSVPSLCLMTSSSSQTIEQPLSPPATPKIIVPAPQIPLAPGFKLEVTSVSTQTVPVEQENVRLSPPTRAPPPVPISIPSIAIHAPTSAPVSPKEPILPPGTKTVSTQTSNDMASSIRSTGMQTEPIRIDKRPVKLPPHLLPSAISSKPATPEPEESDRKRGLRSPVLEPEQIVPVSSARQGLVSRLEKNAEKTFEDRYPGNNDNGPLVRDRESAISRPFRSSSLFAGFDGPSSDEEDHDAELSEDDFSVPRYSTPMLSSRNMKNGRVFNNPPTPVPEDKEVVSISRPSEDSMSSSRILSSRNSLEAAARVGKPTRNSVTRQPSIRRSAMIQSGTTAHMRSRSPSLGSIGSSNLVPKPPFPVPTRSSSRKVPVSKSEGSQSPTPRGNGTFAGRRPYGTRPHQRKDSLRKVRSAAVIQKAARPRSRSPPATPVLPPSPPLPPLPTDSITGQRFGHRPQLSTNTSGTRNGSVGSASQQTSVVDAIAATMVGEWMWKYVRKRKAFGGMESPADVARGGDEAVMTSNGVRHKRWVWISPYERSVLWSSKQPTSGSALMGKSGRKLTIQSVLDVADHTPLPKNAGTQVLFNRSILILTPARALKFTATSQERHYLWLTALSFLAHSSTPIPELGPMPPPPPPPLPIEEIAPRTAGPTLRRSHVRDSVRLAKDRANPVAQRYASRAEPMPDLPLRHYDKPVPDSASPPVVPRGPYHGRKRSSTGPSAPPPSVSYRSFSHQHVPSLYSSGSSDMYNLMTPSVPSSVYNPHSVIASTRTSEASTSTRQHFFDAMGTVRMEAFIDSTLGEELSHAKSGFPKSRIGRRRGNSQWSSGTNEPPRGPVLYDDSLQSPNDPFRGF